MSSIIGVWLSVTSESAAPVHFYRYPTERVIEIPWALSQIPQTGHILDIGSCEATYLQSIITHGRKLSCLDVRPCIEDIPPDATFYAETILGNQLPPHQFDAVIFLSTLEHLGLPCYGQIPILHADRLALIEAKRLLKSGGRLIVTVPAGFSKVAFWFRQYSPGDLQTLFEGFQTTISYWGFDGERYISIAEADVEHYDYREQHRHQNKGAGALACIVAEPIPLAEVTSIHQ